MWWARRCQASYPVPVIGLVRQDTHFGYYANNADTVQMQRNAVSDQGLHCLLTENSMENTVKMKTPTRKPLK